MEENEIDLMTLPCIKIVTETVEQESRIILADNESRKMTAPEKTKTTIMGKGVNNLVELIEYRRHSTKEVDVKQIVEFYLNGKEISIMTINNRNKPIPVTTTNFAKFLVAAVKGMDVSDKLSNPYLAQAFLDTMSYCIEEAITECDRNVLNKISLYTQGSRNVTTIAVLARTKYASLL